jgi:hypothetical protein
MVSSSRHWKDAMKKIHNTHIDLAPAVAVFGGPRLGVTMVAVAGRLAR